jgi:hypothetical protein
MLNRSRTYGWFMLLLAILFLARVLAQLVQFFFHLSFLPPFSAWQSGVLPYPMLIAAQVVIIISMIKIIKQYLRSQIVPNAKTAIIFIILGSIYFFFMVFRMIAGLTFASKDSWFHAPLPTFFHLVLATFILTIGFFNKKYSKSDLPD